MSNQPHRSDVTPLRSRADAEYWELVHQLMDAGWYRMQPRQEMSRTWGFREEHFSPSAEAKECWILADDEETAMRLLLRELHVEVS